MGGISGICNMRINLKDNMSHHESVLEDMNIKLSNRGSGRSGHYIDENAGLSCNNISFPDTDGKYKPVTSPCGRYVMVCDGELYNAAELRAELQFNGYEFKTADQREIMLASYITDGLLCAEKWNGVFAFAVWDNVNKRLVLCRDRFGVKPLFFTIKQDYLVFGSEVKALLAFPGMKAVLDKNGLCEVFGLFPSRTEGGGIFAGMEEIRHGHAGVFDKNGFRQLPYWLWKNEENDLTYADAVEQVKFYVTDAVKRQMISDEPICSFLSGGIDSSIVTAIMAEETAKRGERLRTYSFEFSGNDEFFQSNSFQPDLDKEWVFKMRDLLNTDHTVLECGVEALADHLHRAMAARDFPGMGDIDSSLSYFCGQVGAECKAALTGECADELFGGYPWFHRKLNEGGFPWIQNTDCRQSLLLPEWQSALRIDEYIKNKYELSLKEMPVRESDSKEEARMRGISYLSVKWYMTMLLERMDRMGSWGGLSGRVPYADYRLAELLWKLPWSMKCNGTPKSLLRDAFRDKLPEELINRKKCPYPKTYNPKYEQIICGRLKDVLADSTSPVLSLIDGSKVSGLLSNPSDYGKPWFGQLMAGPQLVAWLLQLNDWLKAYSIII